MALPVLMDKGVVRLIVKNKNDKVLAKSLLTESAELADNMPINSIVAEIVGTVNISDFSVPKGTIVACLPMFSSHILTPLKKGEAVWLISFEEKSETSFNYYWLSRVHGNTFTEDANFTSPNRLITEKPENSSRAFNKSQEIEQSHKSADYPRFDNFIELPDESKLTILSSKSSNSDSEIENLAKSNNLVLEPVPRYFKNEDELAFQGSNNNLIALKTFDGYSSNREWNIENFEYSDNSYSNLTKNNSFNDGFIDIVTGRSRHNTLPESSNFYDTNNAEKHSQTFTLSNFRTCFPTIINSLGRYENNKNFENFTGEVLNNNQEGKPDFNHDAARICLSENRNLDQFFNIRVNLLNQFESGLPSSNNLSTIVTKADNVRIIARQNYIKNENFLDRSNSSIVLLKEGVEPNEEVKGTQSFIVLDELGNVSLDGKKIQLGSNLRISEEHGQGSQVFIGSEVEESQPMVLGNTLKETLDNLCQQFINFIEIFNNHGHSSTSAIGSATNPGVIGETASTTTDITDSINDIKENLITIQSKMGKLQ